MDSARISVRVHPRARRNQLTGIRDGLVGAGVTAPDTGEAANDILISLLAQRLRVGAERIAIVSGDQSRVKQVRIETLAQAEINARLRGLGADARRRQRRWRARAAGLVAVGLVAAAIGIANGARGSTSGPGTPRRPPASVTAGRGTHHVPPGAAAARFARARRRHRPGTPAGVRRMVATVHRSRPDPGRLPQTGQRPSTQTHGFAVRMRGLWAAIAGGPVGTARAAFFPETAYVQLKSVADPAGDFEYRLFDDYRLDIAAARTLLGAGAPGSRLLRTTAVAGYAHWVSPGVCDNRVGYYEEPNARLVYREDGEVSSIGIASLISWRGVWYVVHLGAILRGSGGGMVDAPSVGPGVSADAGSC